MINEVPDKNFPTGNGFGRGRGDYLSPAPQAEPQAVGFSSGLSAAPQAAGASAGLSAAPQAELQAAGFSSGLSAAPQEKREPLSCPIRTDWKVPWFVPP